MGFAHTSSLPVLYNDWSAVMSMKRLITMVSVSLLFAGACIIGSNPAVFIRGSITLVASLSALHAATSPLSHMRDTTYAKPLPRSLCLSLQSLLNQSDMMI